jgi:uncharacterized protein (DUF2062 family)
MRKYFKDRLPDQDSIRQIRWLKPIHHWLQHPNLWHLNRRSVAGGVALGMLCGLVPGPLQMLSAALLAVWLRVNLPVAIFTTLYTNPFTIVPLYVFAYAIGLRVSGSTNGPIDIVSTFPEFQWNDWFSQVWDWIVTLGKPLLIGLPILAVGLALISYIVVRLVWRIAVVLKWRRRSIR